MPDRPSPPPSTWVLLESLFSRALEVPLEQRSEFLARECADRPELKAELLTLLAAREEAGSFLAPPTLDFRGQSFGKYAAEEEIGRGGMSVVYRARRQDGDFEKSVAIKVLLLQANQSLQASETQILASLEHPNIARLLDAGTTAAGFRYLVMEYIDGRPCTDYAAALDLPGKLRLFLTICRAVQFAHQSLVVHRDLKPANILVAADGVPKLLDFGIAKLLLPDPQLVHTQGIRAYTPDYASPEQILGEPVTTAADVYSLGVLLCELVSGRPPRSLNTLGAAELVAAVQKDALPQLAFGGDLAAIAQKALRRLPGERYPSASELANDIERFLADEPVAAQRPTWRYRSAKFLHRHRWPVVLSAAALGALVVASGLAIWQGRLAEQRFAQTRRLARAVMFELHDAVQPLRGSLRPRALIVRESLQYLDALAADKQTAEDVQRDVVRGYLRLAEIEGSDFDAASLGRTEGGLAYTEKALAVLGRRGEPGGGSREWRSLYAEALSLRAAALHRANRNGECQALARQALGIAQQVGDAANQARAGLWLARGLEAENKYTEAAAALRQAVQAAENWYRQEPQQRAAKKMLAEVHNQFCVIHFRLRDLEAAVREASAAYRLDKERYAEDPAGVRADLSSDIGMLAVIYAQTRNFAKAIPMFEEQLSLRRQVAAADPEDWMARIRVGATLSRLTFNLTKAGRPREALVYGEEAVRIQRSALAADPKNQLAGLEFLYATLDLALAYEATGDKRRACALGGETWAAYQGYGKSFQTRYANHFALTKELRERCGGR